MRSAILMLAISLLQGAGARAEDALVYDGEQKALDFMALTYAAKNANLVLVRGLVERGAPVDPPQDATHTEAGYIASQFGTPLEAAARAGYLEIVELLLAKRADPNWQCCSGETSLYLAARNGHLPVVKALLAGGADPRLGAFADPSTPLEAARKGGHSEIVSVLTEAIRTAE